MDRKILICAAIIFIIAALGILAYNNLEIYQGKRIIFPSEEVSSNNYYAMDQWLIQTGFNVRVENYFNPYLLAETPERVVMISSRTYGWYSTEEIYKWIENGGYFIINIEPYNDNINQSLLDFLSDYGISAEITQPVYNNEEETKNDDETSYPDFFMRVAFKFTDNNINVFTMKDNYGNIRLVEINSGNGFLTVTGTPVFMNNIRLKKNENAVLAWKLTGARIPKESEGILFVRSQNTNTAFSVFGSIFERGNPAPVIISALILIFAGFWMTVPLFGKTLKENWQISRPIKDRLTAEILFLKKHHALDYYLESLPRGDDSRNSNNETYNYKDLINQFRGKLNGTTGNYRTPK